MYNPPHQQAVARNTSPKKLALSTLCVCSTTFGHRRPRVSSQHFPHGKVGSGAIRSKLGLESSESLLIARKLGSVLESVVVIINTSAGMAVVFGLPVVIGEIDRGQQ